MNFALARNSGPPNPGNAIPRRSHTEDFAEAPAPPKHKESPNPTDPKLVCIDIQPYDSTQAPERDDILNIGGFSDAVFQVVSSYLAGDAARFVAEVQSIEL